MKMTIITDDQNNILGAVPGHSLSDQQGGVEASVSFRRGHMTHMVEGDDDLSTLHDLDDFQDRLNQHLQQHLAKP